MKIGVIGSGSWGTSLAYLLSTKGHEVILWGRDLEMMSEIQVKRCHPRFASSIKFSDLLEATSDFEKVIQESDCLFFVVPSYGMGEVAERAAKVAKKDVLLVSCAKGFEPDTFKRMSEVLEEKFSGISSKVTVLSGPNHAEEVILGQPSATLVASKDEEAGKRIQDILNTPTFRVYTSLDVIGAEIGGALKNIIALASGILSGLKMGDNSKAALMTRGLAEIARLGVALGANPMTFTGLSGVGDLIVTCTSEHSRNFRAGKLMAQGKTVKEAMTEIGMVVEGIRAAEAAHFLSLETAVPMPISEVLYGVIQEKFTVQEAVARLLEREKNSELEELSYF